MDHDAQVFLQTFEKLKEEGVNVKADIHGIPNLIERIFDENITKDVDWDNAKILFEKTGTNVFSTHIMKKKSDGDIIDEEQILSNAKKNIDIIKSNLTEGMKVYLEGVFSNGGQYSDLKMSSYNLINRAVELADGMILDIVHAQVAARDLDISFEEYISCLNPEKIKIIHFSHSRVNDYNPPGVDDDAVDPHTPCTLEDYETLINVLKRFEEIEMVISEIAYGVDENKERITLSENEYIRDAVALSVAVKFRDIEKVKRVLKYDMNKWDY